jgi:predicted regulator of Ras-like GTPase activity (Roadblock/LC7/MglB family)
MGNVAIHEPEALLASLAADRPGSVVFLEGALAGQAGGHLPGLKLRNLIEWAMRERQTCTLAVASQGRTGALSFEAGRILSAETAERDGAQAATEILSWLDVRVDVLRPAEAAAVRQVREGGLGMLLDRFCGEVEGLIATGVVRRKDGWTVEGRSLDSRLDATAAGCFAGIVDSHLAAVEQLGMGPDWGETEDILITTARAYLLIRLLGESHYHWLAVSSTANTLALCRLAMRSHEPFLLSGLADLEESSEA